MNWFERAEYGRAHQEGRRQGLGEVLTEYLQAVFGPLPPATKERIEQASITELKTWLVACIDARTRDEVFQGDCS